jgi:hypothetical protein
VAFGSVAVSMLWHVYGFKCQSVLCLAHIVSCLVWEAVGVKNTVTSEDGKVLWHVRFLPDHLYDYKAKMDSTDIQDPHA